MSVTAEDIRRRLAIAQIRQRLQSAQPSAPPPDTAAALINSAARSFNNAALGLPRVAGDALALMAASTDALGNRVAAMTPFQESDQMSFGDRFRSAREAAPVRLLRSNALNPTSSQVVSAIRSVPSLLPGGETPGAAFARNLSDEQAAIAAEREAHPVASSLGDIGGNIAALIAGRQPFARRIRNVEQKLDPPVPELFFGRAANEADLSTARLMMDRTLSGPGMRRLTRGLVRATETGTEAAFLESVNRGDDPLLMAGVAAGGQMAGSGALSMMQSLFNKNIPGAMMNLAAAAFATGGTIQLLKSGTPGGEDFILPSIETGFNKVLFGLAVGAAAAAGGVGRPFRGSTTELGNRLVKFTDAVATAPRAATLTLITSLNDASPEEQARFEIVNQQLMQDPLYFGRNIAERLERAYRNGTALREIERLSGNRAFAEKLEALEPTE